MRHYETTYILRPTLGEDHFTEIIERTSAIVTDDDGSIIDIDRWGIKTLAYEIKKETQGYYVTMNYAAHGTTIAEIERIFRIDDRLLRYLTIKLADAIDEAGINTVKEQIAAQTAEAESVETGEAEGTEETATQKTGSKATVSDKTEESKKESAATGEAEDSEETTTEKTDPGETGSKETASDKTEESEKESAATEEAVGSEETTTEKTDSGETGSKETASDKTEESEKQS
jgi:small subunit ribosomal protein S6